MRIIKKYSNRRLYDTKTSGYITLDELSEIIRGGDDVQVVDAKTEEDLTQATLAQIVVESGAAKLLPTPLLTQMIRMGDDALAEFMQLYVSWAFQVYAETKKGLNKLPGVDAETAIGKLLALNPFYRAAKANAGKKAARTKRAAQPRPTPADEPEDEAEDRTEVQELRDELDELKAMIRDIAASQQSS